MLQKGLTSYVVAKIIIAKISKMYEFAKSMLQKLFKILGKKLKKKVSFYIAFDKLFMGKKFLIPYSLSFRVKSPTRERC